MTAPVALYARLSLDRNAGKAGEGLGIERQVGACRDLIDRVLPGAQVVLYEDNDVSATTGKRRPAFERLCGALAAGEHTDVVVWHLDRLLRHPKDLERYIDIVQPANVTTHTVAAGLLDLSTTNGKIQARVAAAFALGEVEQKSDRQKLAARQRATAGRNYSGPRPFGFGRTELHEETNADGETVTVRKYFDLDKWNDEEVAALREAFDRKLAGESDSAIWRSWNAAGIRPVRSAEWSGPTFRQTMKRQILAGRVTLLGETFEQTNPVDPIIEPAKFDAVQALFADPARKTTSGPTPRHLAGGIAMCECGKPMRSGTSGPREKRSAVYRCSNTEHRCQVQMHVMDAVLRDAVVATFILDRERGGQHADQAVHDQIASLYAEIQTLTRKLARQSDQAEALDNDPVIIGKMRETQQTIQAHRDRIDTLVSSSASAAMTASVRAMVETVPGFTGEAVREIEAGILAVEFGRNFDDLKLDAKRNLIRSILEITVVPGRSRGRERIRVRSLAHPEVDLFDTASVYPVTVAATDGTLESDIADIQHALVKVREYADVLGVDLDDDSDDE